MRSKHNYQQGDIVWLPFPYSDLTVNKHRPALVLVDLPGDDLILCQITSKIVADNMAVKVSIDDVDNGKLYVESNARPNKLFTADASIIINKICSLKPNKLDEVIEKILNMFKRST